MLREVRLALLDADAGLPVVKDFIGRVKEKALGQEVIGSLTPGQALVGIVHQELVGLMGGANEGLDFATEEAYWAAVDEVKTVERGLVKA